MKRNGKNSRRYTGRGKIPVVARMLAVRMVYVRKAGIDETAAHLMRSARWVRNWLRRYDEVGLEGLRDLPRSGRSMQTRHWEASSDYTQAFHQAAKSPNMTAWNAEPCLTEAV